MYPNAAIQKVVCLVDIIDDDVSQNHCVRNWSSTKTVSSSNLSQQILTMTVHSFREKRFCKVFLKRDFDFDFISDIISSK